MFRLRTHHDLTGRVEVVLTIAPDGSVGEVTTEGSTLANPAMEACLVGKVRTWQLPHPPTNKAVKIRYPLVFNRVYFETGSWCPGRRPAMDRRHRPAAARGLW